MSIKDSLKGRKYKLLLLIGKPGSGKSKYLLNYSKENGIPILDFDTILGQTIPKDKDINYIYDFVRGFLESYSPEEILIDKKAILYEEGTNIDFVGGDSYGKTPTQLATFIPTKGLNYKMIMECGAEEANSQVFPFAALTTNTAFSYYEYVGPDNHGLYDLTSSRGVVKPHNENTLEVIRAQNRLFNAAMQDVATKASYKSLMVHNGTASDPSTTKGVCGITLDPLSPTQAISICRSDSELVLLTVQRGDWNIPASLHAKSASKGYFDVNNKWVEEEALSFNGTYLPRVEGSVIRILLDTETDGIHDMSDLRYTPTKNVYNLQGLYSSSPHLPSIFVIHGRKFMKH